MQLYPPGQGQQEKPPIKKTDKNGKKPFLSARVAYSNNTYSVLKAVTGSCLDAVLDGMRPPIRVSTTLNKTRIIAAAHGMTALTSSFSAILWIRALIGIKDTREMPTPKIPARKPVISVTAVQR